MVLSISTIIQFTEHRTIKMKPINVTDDSFVEYNEE